VYDSGTGNNNFQTKNKLQAKNSKITKRRHKYPKLVNNIQFANVMKRSEPNPLTSSGADALIQLNTVT
jgi:hypothetical protein